MPRTILITGANNGIGLAMARAFNYRQGLTAKDDVSHWRFSTPFETAPTDGPHVPADDIAQAIELYREMRGWDAETGAPTTGKLYELGVGWVADLIYGESSSGKVPVTISTEAQPKTG